MIWQTAAIAAQVKARNGTDPARNLNIGQLAHMRSISAYHQTRTRNYKWYTAWYTVIVRFVDRGRNGKMPINAIKYRRLDMPCDAVRRGEKV